LTKFDGKSFINYEDIAGDKNIIIWNCQIISDTLIWLATRKGLIKFDGTKFENYSTKYFNRNFNVWSISISANNGLYLGTDEGLYLIQNQNVTFYNQLKGKNVSHILEDSQQRLWVIADDSLLIFSNDKFVTPPFLSNFDLSAVTLHLFFQILI
jgi:ligand-binding sensor domain-containing protein